MVKLRVNGQEQSFDGDPSTPLLWYLRDELGLIGTKYGCGVALCGACTVHVDGEAARACITAKDVTFISAPAYSRGNDSRTQPDLRTPGIATWDLSIARNQRIRENTNFQLRGELFNAFNTPQFGAPEGSVTSTQFGRITSAGSARVVQIGLRLAF